MQHQQRVVKEIFECFRNGSSWVLRLSLNCQLTVKKSVSCEGKTTNNSHKVEVAAFSSTPCTHYHCALQFHAVLPLDVSLWSPQTWKMFPVFLQCGFVKAILETQCLTTAAVFCSTGYCFPQRGILPWTVIVFQKWKSTMRKHSMMMSPDARQRGVAQWKRRKHVVTFLLLCSARLPHPPLPTRLLCWVLVTVTKLAECWIWLSLISFWLQASCACSY